MRRILPLSQIAVAIAACLAVHRAAALTCNNYTDGFLFDEFVKTHKTNKTNARVCHLSNSGPTKPACFEFATRKASGPVAYGAGCGSQCPPGTNVLCRLCHADHCNTGLADEIRKQNMVCYTGPFAKGAMTLRRRRKVWCADDEKQCFIITWMTEKIRAPKYFGGCGHQSCSKSSAKTCSIANCTKSLCNSPPSKPPKGCPATGCGAEKIQRQCNLLLLWAFAIILGLNVAYT